ncbi:hypothetical protein Anas_03743 [Armadillidium nasatum]|uniref:Uncharacterized protein n=1 Tax=Armadillidium nasatum TaxID=96803 RepID=A0A5N5T1R2_9CRUS|nr:hypothetical protein Anas_03743 [Armadillidium nasatum]
MFGLRTTVKFLRIFSNPENPLLTFVLGLIVVCKICHSSSNINDNNQLVLKLISIRLMFNVTIYRNVPFILPGNYAAPQPRIATCRNFAPERLNIVLQTYLSKMVKCAIMERATCYKGSCGSLDRLCQRLVSPSAKHPDDSYVISKLGLSWFILVYLGLSWSSNLPATLLIVNYMFYSVNWPLKAM